MRVFRDRGLRINRIADAEKFSHLTAFKIIGTERQSGERGQCDPRDDFDRDPSLISLRQTIRRPEFLTEAVPPQSRNHTG
jgi:hypothetical protein